MSSANTISNLENVSPSDGYENNDSDNVSTNTCNSKIETDDNSSIRKISKNKKYLNKMLHLLKEFLIMVLVAVTYAAITNDPPKIGKSPAAYRFFPEGSHITDWYKGEISEAISHARSADIAFVMFYAPWDAESQHARREFQIVAKYMHHEVTFSAVNCWQPGSECKTQYSKVYKWPVLIAYPTHGRGIQYNGPLIAVYMMQFLKKVINPFTRREEFNLQNVGKYEAFLVGKLNASPKSKEYNIFYQTILRLLEKDPIQEIGVSIHTHSRYDQLGQPNKRQLILYLWNETLIYSDESEWTIDSLLEWIMKHVHRLTTWVSPSGSKSLSLSSYLQPGPTFVLFTPKNPLELHNDFYSMVREIAQDYNNCGDNLWVPLVQLTIRDNRREKYLQHLRLLQECSTRKSRVQEVISSNLWNNVSYCLENKHHVESPFLSESSMVSFYGGISGLCVELLKNFNHKATIPKKCEVKYHNHFYPTSKLSDLPDPKSPENLRIFSEKERCRLFTIAQKYQSPVFSNELYMNGVALNVTGLKCKTNKTLSFISMDSLYYHHFAEKLGIDLSTQQYKSAVVILDDKMESHYHMTGSLTETNIKNFVYNYTVGSLPRALSSSTSVISKNTHSYPKDHRCSFDANDSCTSIKELNSVNFLQTVSQNNKAVIIFYYSKQCSFCNGLSYRFLTVAKYFSTMENIEFARIDGELNLLPWEYTMETYPTILFVPPREKSESRVFPIDMPITVPNLLGFIMANLKPQLKLEVMWTLCRRANFTPNITECSLSLRHQTTYLIEKTLQRWRSSPSSFEKAVLFERLRIFHDLYSIFVRDQHEFSLAQNYFNQLKTIEFSQAKIKI